MKKLLIPLLIVIISLGCKKTNGNKNTCNDCGCNSDSIVGIIVDKFGTIFYDSANHVGSQLPVGWYFAYYLGNDSSSSGLQVLHGICNPTHPAFKLETDKLNNPSRYSKVYLTGKETKLGVNQNYGFNPATLISGGYIIIDSIKIF